MPPPRRDAGGRAKSVPPPDGDEWIARRGAAIGRDAPIAIYECHPGSWMRVAEEGERFLTYGELADRLVPYVRDLGFTHVELLPVAEHPFDGSGGVQPSAPTSGFGSPAEFAAFVATCHAEGIGLIVGWAPGQLQPDPHGLTASDGAHLHDYHEVADNLIAGALIWLEHYGVDGLRIDAVASMLYLDYGRGPGEWVPNRDGGNENLEAIDFLRRLNELCTGRFPSTTTIAEESTAWPGVTRPTDAGGLGFGYKWNMGWTNDTLRYMKNDPVQRHHHHNDLTSGLGDAFSENFVLPLSHGEVVRGKGSLIGRMPGDDWQQFANLRAYFGFMWTHPGKKLLFMGGEFAQRSEWSHDHSLDWDLLREGSHRGVQSLVRDLNVLYRQVRALHVLDCEAAGFEWIDSADAERSALSYLRLGEPDDAPVVVVCNFTPVVRAHYRVGVPRSGRWRIALDTDAEVYGGSGAVAAEAVVAEDIPANGRPCSLNLTLPPLATVILEWSLA